MRLFAQENSRPTIFVAPLDGDKTQVADWQPALGDGLAEMLTTELAKLDKFQILESTALEHLKNEIKLGEEGYVAKDEKVEKGGFAGADFMFRGKVTRFGAKAQGVNLGGFVPGSLGNLGVKRNKSDVRIDWRIVDAANRKVVKAGQAVADETGLGFDVGVAVNGQGGNIGLDNKEFMNSSLGKATVKAIDKIIADVKGVTLPVSGRQMAGAKVAQSQKVAEDSASTALKSTPGKVIAVISKGMLIVSLGSKQGLKVGDKLKLYETVDLKDDKGAVVFSEEKLAGEITLDSVQDERSKASYSGSAEIKVGWLIKFN
jgi:curli biogenesis system outer membrane secretion channel CsgG